jgi:hypothetical protein
MALMAGRRQGGGGQSPRADHGEIHQRKSGAAQRFDPIPSSGTWAFTARKFDRRNGPVNTIASWAISIKNTVAAPSVNAFAQARQDDSAGRGRASPVTAVPMPNCQKNALR